VLLLPGLLGFLTLGPFFLASHVGEQALHFAAEFEGGRHLVELLLSPSLAVDVNVTDRFGRTPVRVITSFVLNVAGRGTNSNPIEQLHLALATNHGTEIAKRLLKEPAIDVTLTDEKMRLPLHIACTKGGHEVKKRPSHFSRFHSFFSLSFHSPER
jgi:ankyrin repeat protein